MQARTLASPSAHHQQVQSADVAVVAASQLRKSAVTTAWLLEVYQAEISGNEEGLLAVRPEEDASSKATRLVAFHSSLQEVHETLLKDLHSMHHAATRGEGIALSDETKQALDVLRILKESHLSNKGLIELTRGLTALEAAFVNQEETLSIQAVMRHLHQCPERIKGITQSFLERDLFPSADQLTAYEQELLEVFESMRSQLVNTSLRFNPYLNFRASKSGRSIACESGNTEALFHSLVSDRVQVPIVASLNEEEEKTHEELPAEAALSQVSHTAEEIRIPLDADTLNDHLLFISQRAEEHKATKGTHPLCLSLGMLHWQPHDSKTQRAAPLMQLSIEIEAGATASDYRIRLADDVLDENGPLRKRLADEFGIQLPPLTAGSDPVQYFEEVAKAIAHKKGWSVDPSAVSIGLFSSGVALFDDLDPSQWSTEQKPWRSPLVSPLLAGGYHPVTDVIREDVSLDTERDLDETPPFFGCDSSQERVLMNFARGNTTVLIGPPGSGKSFAIAEALAQAVWRGEKILFVCQKPAALDVVYRRLEMLGLGNLVLALGTGESKKEVYEDLQETIALGRPTISKPYEEARMAFEEAQAHVHACTGALLNIHERSGYTAAELAGEALYAAVASYTLSFPDLASLSRSDFKEVQRYASSIQDEIERSSLPRNNAFSSIRISVCSPVQKTHIREQIEDGRKRITTLIDESSALQTMGGRLPGSVSHDALKELLVHLKDYHQGRSLLNSSYDSSGLNTKRNAWNQSGSEVSGLVHQYAEALVEEAELKTVLRDEAFEQSHTTLLQELQEAGSSIFFFVKPSYWRALGKAKKLFKQDQKPGYKDCENALGILTKNEALRDAISTNKDVTRLCGVLPASSDVYAWKNLDAAVTLQQGFFERPVQLVDKGFLDTLAALMLKDEAQTKACIDRVDTALHHYEVHRISLEGLLQLHDTNPDLHAQQSEYQRWSQEWDSFDDALRMNRVLEESSTVAPWLSSHVRSLEALSEPLPDVLKREWLASCVSELYEECPELQTFDSLAFDSAREALVAAEEELKDACIQKLLQDHWDRIPRTVSGGRLALLEKELSRTSRHRAVTDFLRECAEPVQQIKPIVLATPKAVAESIPRSMQFDRFVGDEGSQQEVIDALGSLQRVYRDDAHPVSALIAGDDMQMAPSRLFRKGSGADDEGVSILDRMLERDASRYMLTGSYRFKDPSLVQCSNVRFYGGKLRVFPGAYREERPDVGLKYHFNPDNIYQGKGANPDEARSVARRAMNLILEDQSQTIGVVAFSQEQMKLILKEMQKLRRQHPEANDYFTKHADEPFFVRNLENVQGDERDVIIVSTAFGKDEEGKFRRQFGSLNRPHGEKGLNVLFTRAKKRCEIHTAIDPDWIETDDVRSEAIHALKAYLQYARDGEDQVQEEQMKRPASAFEHYLQGVLEDAGYVVTRGVGTLGCSVNLAVHDPEHPSDTYLAGILIDDEQFFNAGSFRERDAITESVLTSLGWNVAYCHAAGFLRDPEGEKERLLSMLQSVKDGTHVAESTFGRLLQRSVARDTTPGRIERARGVPYQEASLPRIRDLGDSTEVSTAIHELVSVESPIHEKEVYRKLRDSVGVKRLSAEHERTIADALSELVDEESIYREGEFYWIDDSCEVRSRDQFKPAHKRLDLIAPEELKEAIQFTVRHAGGISEQDAVEETCQVLGFKSTPKDAMQRLLPLLHELRYHEAAFAVRNEELHPHPEYE